MQISHSIARKTSEKTYNSRSPNNIGQGFSPQYIHENDGRLLGVTSISDLKSLGLVKFVQKHCSTCALWCRRTALNLVSKCCSWCSGSHEFGGCCWGLARSSCCKGFYPMSEPLRWWMCSALMLIVRSLTKSYLKLTIRNKGDSSQMCKHCTWS